jgi:hypothetical protein
MSGRVEGWAWPERGQEKMDAANGVSAFMMSRVLHGGKGIYYVGPERDL